MSYRGRPKKKRFVEYIPKIFYFSPRGRPGRPEEVVLALEELEALKLADLENLTQKEASQKMQISQQTFSRILNKARKILTDAIINGKIIRIQNNI